MKNEEFFDLYSSVKELNVKAYDRIRKEITSGCTEKELYEKVVDTYLSNTDGNVKYCGDFLSGERTAGIDGPATDKVIDKGDVIIVDASCEYRGVFCDTTRTFFCEEPTVEQRMLYAFLCQLLEETKKLLRPGVKACSIFEYVNKRIEEEGYGSLVHHAGHGLKNSWCEEPRFVEDNETVLKEDMIVTLEPGVYFEGKYGMRVENNYRVTKNGGVDIFKYTTDINDFILR